MQRFTIARDDSVYLAFPDVTLTPSGRLVCVISECTHHGNRDYTRFMLTHSNDRGRTWTAKRPLSEALRWNEQTSPAKTWWNCPRIVTLGDGRLCVVGDRITGGNEGHERGEQSNWLWFSGDDGMTWAGPIATPVQGIVPDKLVELRQGKHKGRWILSAHTILPGSEPRAWTERTWISDNQGRSWRGPITIAESRELKLCEGSIVELPAGELVCYLRENSFLGLDAFKCVSTDGGETWRGPDKFPLPGCHRPVPGVLNSGRVLITHRFLQGGKGWLGTWTQNFFAAMTDTASCLATQRREMWSRILPIDFDRSPHADIGYSGWVQFPDGEIYIAYYLVDDAPKAQIRGVSLRESDFVLA